MAFESHSRPTTNVSIDKAYTVAILVFNSHVSYVSEIMSVRQIQLIGILYSFQ